MTMILRETGTGPEYWTLEPNLTVGSVFGAFTPDKTKAFLFGDTRSADLFMKKWLTHIPRLEIRD